MLYIRARYGRDVNTGSKLLKYVLTHIISGR